MSAATTIAPVTTAPTGTGTTITPTLPTGHAVGDEVRIWVVNSGVTAWSAPTGWTIRQQQPSGGNASTGVIGTLLYHRVVSGDTLPLASPVCNLGATVTRSAVAFIVRGADLEGVHTLQEWLAFGSIAGTANPVRPPSVTTRSPENLVHIYYGSRAATTAPEQTNYTQVQQVINSGIIVNNVSERTVADQATTLANQDASPTSGARWIAMISCTPSPDYPYYRSGSQAFNASGLNATPALPPGTTASDNRGNKDLIIATVECAGTPTIAPNTPADWTALPDWSNITGGGGTTVRKYYTFYDGTLDRQFNRSTTGEIFVYFSVYHNAHQTIPTGTSAVQQNASSTTSTFPALPRTGTKTTVQATCVADATPTFTAPANWIERNDSQGVTCADQSFNATGSTASASFTLSSASPTLTGLMEVFSVASQVTLTLIPATATLTIGSFAPVIKLQLTPAAASLSLTTFAPTVTTAAAQQYYRALTIDHNLVPNTDQTDFPVLVSFTHDDLKSMANDGHVANTSGFDLLFFSDAALTQSLSHEIESYNPVTGTVVMWVKLSTVSHTVDTIFYVKYGDTAISTSQEDVPDVWSNDFLGVFHLGNGTSLENAKNSVTGGNSTISGVGAGTGQISGGADFTGGSTADHITTNLGGLQPTTATYEIWSKRDGEGGGGFGRMWVKGHSANSRLQFYNDPTTYAPDEVYIFSAQWDGPSVVGSWSITRPSSGSWHSLAVTYDNSSSANDPLIYLGGISVTVTERITPSGSLPDETGENYALGQRVVTLNRKWNGGLDEFRVSSVIRSADWLATCSNNQDDPVAFLSMGEELTVGDVAVTPATAILTTTTFAPVLKLVVTPASTSLSLSTFAPSVTVKVTISSASLNLTTFAPVVDVSADVTVTPTSATLTATGFAPQLHTAITPASQFLTLTSFAPVLKLVVAPASQSLAMTTFAPIVQTNTILIPTAASLALTRFAPVLVEQVTPAVASLTFSTSAPTVTATVNVTATPTAASLILTGFAPALHERVIPGATTLSLTTFAPTITISADITVQPLAATLTLTGFAPALQLVVTPSTGSLSLSTFAPTITVSADKTVEPASASLTLQTFAPVLRAVVTPATATLTVTANAPVLKLQVQPAALALTLSTFAPTLTISTDITVVPGSAALTLTTFAPAVTASMITTPPMRTFVIESQLRSYTVARSNRVHVVPKVNREQIA